MGQIVNKLAFHPRFRHVEEGIYYKYGMVSAEHLTEKNRVAYRILSVARKKGIIAQENVMVLFSMGNAQTAQDISLARLAESFLKTNETDPLDKKYFFVLYDYPQYGYSSECKLPLTEQGICDAGLEVFSEAFMKIHPDRVLLWGSSIGSVPTCDLAQKLSSSWMGLKKVGVLLENPLYTGVGALQFISETVSKWLGYTIPYVLPFNNVERLKNLGSMKPQFLIFHASEDRILLPWHGYSLFEIVKTHAKFQTIRGAGHNNVDWGRNSPLMELTKSWIDIFLSDKQSVILKEMDVEEEKRDSSDEASPCVPKNDSVRSKDLC